MIAVREALQQPPLDWFNIVLALREAGLTDPEFSLLRLRHFPMLFIKDLYLKAAEYVKMKRNLDALPVAKLGVLIYQVAKSLGGQKGGRDLDVTVFLPHPELVIGDTKKLSPTGATIARRIMQEDKLAAKIIPVLSQYL